MDDGFGADVKRDVSKVFGVHDLTQWQIAFFERAGSEFVSDTVVSIWMHRHDIELAATGVHVRKVRQNKLGHVLQKLCGGHGRRRQHYSIFWIPHRACGRARPCGPGDLFEEKKHLHGR